MLGLPLELVVIIGIAAFGLLVYYGRKMSVPSGVRLPAAPVVIGGIVLIMILGAVFYFWSSIKGVAVEGNSGVESLVGEGNTIYVWVILGLVSLLLLKSLFSKKKEKVHKIDKFALTILVVFAAPVIAVVLIIIAGLVDWVTNGSVQQQINNAEAVIRGERRPTVDYAGDECDLEERLDLLRNTLSRQWVEITLCKDDGPFSVFVPSGTKPRIEYRDKGDRVLSSRPISSFVEMEYSWGKPGGMPNLYRFSIPRSNNGFDTALRDSVTFEIRAAEGTSSTTQPQSVPTPSTEERAEATNVKDCNGKYKVLSNCKVVTFAENEHLTRSTPVGGCLMADPKDGAKRIHLGGNQYQYTPYHSGVKMWFYEIDQGQTIFGVKCG